MGGVGIRQIRDMNLALLTKLNWNMRTTDHKLWVQLIKSKYLCSRRRLDFEQTHCNTSWFWHGLKRCDSLLQGSAFFQVGRYSTLNIKIDLWLLKLPNFWLPDELTIPDDINYVCDLMEDDGRCWDRGKILTTFPPAIGLTIINTPILDQEHDCLVWTTSMKEVLSVGSAFRKIIQDRQT